MKGRHRMPEPPARIRPATGHAGFGSRSNLLIGALTATVASAGVLAALGVELLTPPAPPAPSPAPAAPPHAVPAQPASWQPSAEPFTQEGRIIAVSPDSVTARSADGYTQTYRVTSDTTSLTPTGNRIVSPATAFAVNDEVQIVGEVRGGTAVATTVADRTVTGLDGPPMDAVDAPVSGT
jgi:hypothetical protein